MKNILLLILLIGSSAAYANEDNDKALRLLKVYSSNNPNDIGLQARLGDAYFSTKDIAAAKVSYQKASELQKDYPGLAGKLGTIYSMTKELSKSEDSFRLASKLNPNNYDYLASLSSVLLANKKYQDSIGFAKKALQVKATSESYITLGTAYELSGKDENALIAFQRAKDLGYSAEKIKTKIDQLNKKING